jgi:ribonuclease HI
MIESYSDGSGKNSSGKGAASFLIVKDQSIIYQESLILINKTNNEAEYVALHSAIEWLLKQGYDTFTCYVDSELIFKQLIGDYKVNVPELIIWNTKIKDLWMGKMITFQWVPRTNVYIKQADSLNRRIMRIP